MFQDRTRTQTPSLVDTAWVCDHLHDPRVRLIEADEDVSLYSHGHIPGAVKVTWRADMQQPLTRDFIDLPGFARLMSLWGIRNDTTVVFYGDQRNLRACYGVWLFRYRGHADTRLMDGGRLKWEAERRRLTDEVPGTAATRYVGLAPEPQLRASRVRVRRTIGAPETVLVDVRSPDEYRGDRVLADGDGDDCTRRAGHIPGAVNIPWRAATCDDGTFRPRKELDHLYTSHGVTPDKQVITYGRIGERSAHSWFALTQLLGYSDVRNYDGSWSEWGSLVRVPIARGSE